MKLIASFPLLFCAAVAMSQTQVRDMTGGYGPDSSYNKSFNTSDVFTFNGKVMSKQSVTPLKGMSKAIALTVKQDDKSYIVHLGPEWFVGKMPIGIKVGDMVTIQGSRSTLNGKKIVYAELVTKGKQTVAIRSKSGWGRWNAVEPNVEVPENSNYTGTVAGISTVNYGGTNYDVYNLQTGLGNISVVGAPSWYAQHQPRAVQIGNNVTVIGAARMIPVGGNVFVADGFYTGGSYVVANPWWN